MSLAVEETTGETTVQVKQNLHVTYNIMNTCLNIPSISRSMNGKTKVSFHLLSISAMLLYLYTDICSTISASSD